MSHDTSAVMFELQHRYLKCRWEGKTILEPRELDREVTRRDTAGDLRATALLETGRKEKWLHYGGI